MSDECGPLRIVLPYFSIGLGHEGTAMALKQEFERQVPNATVHTLQCCSHVGLIYRMMITAYILCIHRVPKAGGVFYRLRVVVDKLIDHGSRSWLFFPARILVEPLRRSAARLGKVLSEINPNLIVCPDPVPALIVSMLKGRGKLEVPMALVATDYGVDAHWPPQNCEHFFVADAIAKDYLVSHRVTDDQIDVTGIPIKKSGECIAREKVLLGLGLQPGTFTVFCTGGGLGVGDVYGFVKQLLKNEPKTQIVAACGRNRKLMKRLKSIDKGVTRIAIIGWTDNLSDYLNACDVFIGKPGGIIVTEALSLGVVPVVSGKHPNAKFILNAEAGLTFQSPAEMIEAIRGLRKSPGRLERFKKNALAVSHSDAAKTIVNKLLKILN
jgi:processive 1,2-diacylglycerol beta-glucosyltransferase